MGSVSLIGFDVGEVSVTDAVRDLLQEEGATPETYLVRHMLGDWGERVGPGDAAVNDQAARGMGPVLSAYLTPSGAEIWICTSDDHSRTEILLPEEFPE